MRTQNRNSSAVKAENIASLAALVDVMKQNQVTRPRAKFDVAVGGEKFSVNLLPSGYIEFDGKVRPMNIEKAFDEAITSAGATVYVH